MWWKKEALKKKSITVEDILGQLNEVKPKALYCLWFERLLSPRHIELIRRAFADKDCKVIVLSGIEAPEIFECIREEDNVK